MTNEFYILDNIDYIIDKTTLSTEKFIALIDAGLKEKDNTKNYFFNLDFLIVKDIKFIENFVKKDIRGFDIFYEFTKYVYETLSTEEFKVMFPQNHKATDDRRYLNRLLTSLD